MRRAKNDWKAYAGAVLASAALNACSYDFDALVAQTGAGASGGTGGTAGEGGAGGAAGSADDGAATGGSAGQADGSAGSGGTAGTGGAGGATGSDSGPGDSGKDGTGGTDAGKGGDASSDRASDVRTDAAFDCAAVGGTVYQAHCYYPSTAMTNWDTANTTGCASPSHLVTITTAGEQGVVAAILPGKDRWIGLRKDPGPPNTEMAFHWVTGEALSFKTWDAYDSGAPEPNYTGDCVRMRPTNNWGDTPCTDSYVAVCERE